MKSKLKPTCFFNIKYVILILLSLLLNKAVYAQFYKLDVKAGFNNFKLGESLTDVKKKSKISFVERDSDNKNLTFYKVKDLKSYKIFEYSLDEMKLGFYNDKLYQIRISPAYIYRKEENDLIYHDILRRIQLEYGRFVEKELTTLDKLIGIKEKFERLGDNVLLRFENGPKSYYSFFDIAMRSTIMNEEKTGL
jgi:hypothetical protein